MEVIFSKIRQKLRKWDGWIKFQEVNREGWWHALKRNRIQRMILDTPPFRTSESGDTEVRIVTWRRDWLNAIWSLKSFYFYSETNYPLYIHDGGLEKKHLQELNKHFPDAKLISREEGNYGVGIRLNQNDYPKCLLYRSKNISTIKLFDFFLLSKAKWIITIDPDVLFFKKPNELIGNWTDSRVNLFNRDMKFAYSMDLDEMDRAFGVRPKEFINSGLSRVACNSIDFKRIEKWLENPKLFADRWVTEQTLHALCSTIHGVDLLPPNYVVSTEPGLDKTIVAKHYPGFIRPLLYSEGMETLRRSGFIFE